MLGVIRLMYCYLGAEFLRGTWVQTTYMCMTLLTIFTGSLLAYHEGHLKKRLAWSSVSQVSYVLFGLSTMNPVGLVGALLVGVSFAKAFAFALGKPLIAVNHIRGHLAAAYLDCPDLKPPFVTLLASGGHTAVLYAKSEAEFEILGATLDDAAGEAFDKIGRVIGMPYPGGAAMDKLAYEGDPNAVKLPSPAMAGDNLDFSFSGLKTAALNYINGERQRGSEPHHADLTASYTKVIVDALVKKMSIAFDKTSTKTLVLAGGVAANSHIRRALEELCKKKKVSFCKPSLALCSDNAAMVAAAGYFEYLAGHFADTSLNASALDGDL